MGESLATMMAAMKEEEEFIYYECLYTKHVTQKRKNWVCGCIRLSRTRNLVLYDYDDSKIHEQKSLCSKTFHPSEWQQHHEDGRIALDRYLLDIDSAEIVFPDSVLARRLTPQKRVAEQKPHRMVQREFRPPVRASKQPFVAAIPSKTENNRERTTSQKSNLAKKGYQQGLPDITFDSSVEFPVKLAFPICRSEEEILKMLQ